MPTYERVESGRVIERVQPLAGDYEDTRLGLLALDGREGWRVADNASQPPVDDAPAEQHE